MYWIITDSAIDMNREWIDAQEDFKVVPLAYLLDGTVHVPDGTDESNHAFYDLMRGGKMPSTSQVTPSQWADEIRPVLEAGNDVLLIAFSSGLSGTCQAAMMAAEELQEEFPERTIKVVDSLCASAGQGLLVHYALKNRGEGMSLADNADWLAKNVQNVIHWFTVNDLMHLYRGGRVSKTSALIGTLVRIKPVMRVDEKGKLAVKEKAAGRKRSISALAERICHDIVNPEGQLVLISHGDCADEAQILADMIKEKLPVSEVRLSYVGSVIGAHTGPGVIAVFCMGNTRTPNEK